MLVLADLKGRQGHVPLGSKFFQFHAIFGKHWPNISFSHPPFELVPQPRGNPGSATGLSFLIWTFVHSVFFACIYENFLVYLVYV